MSKITFRADADLVDRLEAVEGSKSEVMREALRAYLDHAERGGDTAASSPDTDASDDATDTRSSRLDGALAARVDELVTARLDEELRRRRLDEAFTPPRRFDAATSPAPVNLTVNVDGASAVDVADDTTSASDGTADGRRAQASDTAASDRADATETTCAQCGEGVSDDHVYCPNCGEKATHRLFCECGDELRSDWGFCPGCGRRTPAADVLDGR